MVIMKKNTGYTSVHPGLKEVIYVSMPMRPNTSKFTKQINDLPKYHGLIGTAHPGSGIIQLSPLKVTAIKAKTTKNASIPRRNANKSKSPIDDIHDELNKSSRRVRFALPKSEGDLVSSTPSAATLNHRSSATSIAASNHPRRSSTPVGTIFTTTRSATPAPAPSYSHTASTANRNYSHSNLRRTSSDWNCSVGGGGGNSCIASYTSVNVPVTASPGVRARVYPTGRYARGTLSPTANAAVAPTPGGRVLLKAAANGDDDLLRDILRRAALVGIADVDLNAVDKSGRTVLSHLASNGPVDILERILVLPGLDPNRADNEGNTPLHFAAQAGQIECLNCMLTRCKGVDIDARNNMGFTPLMKAALQGRNRCAKTLLFAGANPTLKDNGRSLRADQWARFCGRYVCADVIEKHARQKLLERSTSYGNWGVEPELTSRTIMGKVMPCPVPPVTNHSGIRSKLKKVFRTSSGPGHSHEASSVRLVTQLTSAALCASTPVLPSAPSVPPVVKSLIRPLTVPRLQITLVNGGHHGIGHTIETYFNAQNDDSQRKDKEYQHHYNSYKVTDKTAPLIQPVRMKKHSK